MKRVAILKRERYKGHGHTSKVPESLSQMYVDFEHYENLFAGTSFPRNLAPHCDDTYLRYAAFLSAFCTPYFKRSVIQMRSKLSAPINHPTCSVILLVR